MAIEDLGTLADYELNGDNYERVNPDGSVDVIPTVYQQQIIVPPGVCGYDSECVPQDTPFTWTFLDPNCGQGESAYCIAHDLTTGFYFIPLNCDEIVLGLGTVGDCAIACAQVLEGLQGTPLANAFPPWLIQALGFDSEALLDIDFFFVACATGTIVIPNFPTGPIPVGPPPPPPPGSCAQYTFYNGGCFVKV